MQQRSQWHQVTGGTKSPRMHLPDSEQHQATLSVSLSALSTSCFSLTCTPLTPSKKQAWPFVSVVCRVLYYAMIESLKVPDHRRRRDKRRAAFYFYARGVKYRCCLELRLIKPPKEQRCELEVTKNSIRSSPGNTFNTSCLKCFL